jgi:hemolysin activation/secretion protein
VATGLGDLDTTTLMLGADAQGRWQDGGLADLLLSASGELNWRQSPSWSLNVRLQGDAGHKLAPDRQILLGGGDGVRGYPLRYQRGEQRLALNVEQRLFTDWQPLRLFNVGAVAFVDAGRVWGDVGATDAGALLDAGIGLRLGNRRSGSARMIHIDLAFPLTREEGIDGMQLLVGSSKQF